MIRKITVLLSLIFMAFLASCGGGSGGGGGSNNNQPQQKVVFTGASTIARGNWSAYFGIPIDNKGVGGIESTQLKNDIVAQVATKPDKIFFSIGTNNILNRHEGFLIGDISTIIDKIRTASPATKIYVISMLPVRDDFARSLIEIYNGQIESLCRSKNVTFISVYNLFKAGNSINENYYEADGLHLVPAGYQVYANAIRFYVLL